MRKVKIHEISKFDNTAKRYKLMLKSHWETGIQYLCVTTRYNYLEYSGSGIRWLNLLKKFPSEIYTQLLYSSDNVEDFNKECVRISEMLNVVNCEYFANLIPERGYTKETFEVNHTESGKLRMKESARNNGLKLYENKLGIHNPQYLSMRKEWARNGANALVSSGNIKGCTNKEWMENNKSQQIINCRNAGKVGGSIVGKMFWWNNGIVNKKSHECPDGFVRGMLMSDKKRKQVYEVFLQKNKKE